LRTDRRFILTLRGARAGLAWVSGRTSFSVEGELQPPHTEGELGVERELTFNVRAGAMVPVTRTLQLGFGAFTDRSPEEAPLSILEQRLDFYGLTAGVRLDSAHGLAATERTTSLVFSTTLALRYTYGVGEVGGFEFESQPTGSPGENRAASAHVHDLGIHLGSTVYFRGRPFSAEGARSLSR
jgi:hypothetical protein